LWSTVGLRKARQFTQFMSLGRSRLGGDGRRMVDPVVERIDHRGNYFTVIPFSVFRNSVLFSLEIVNLSVQPKAQQEDQRHKQNPSPI